VSRASKNFFTHVVCLKELEIMWSYFEVNRVSTIDTAELLRAELVMAVSALDYYVHQIVRDALVVKLVEGNNYELTDKVAIPLAKIMRALRCDNVEDRLHVLGEAIEEVLCRETYQSPRSIEAALILIEVKQLWSRISEKQGVDVSVARGKLDVIVYRRNKIVHEADIDPVSQGKRLIAKQEVSESVEFISDLVRVIDQLITSQYPELAT